MRRTDRRFAVAVALGLGLAALAARAETLRVEAVGSVPLAAGAAGGSQARQAALEAGVREAVDRAAIDLATQAGSKAGSETVLAALGADRRAYAGGYRILEDRGERDPLLEASPAAAREYVVTVEVEVDADRLREALLQAGLLGTPTGRRRGVTLALEGVDSAALWERIQRALEARGGAVRPLEFSRGRVLAEVITDEGPGDLIARLGHALGDTRPITPLGLDPSGAMRVSVAPAGGSPGDAGGTTALDAEPVPAVPVR